MPPSTGREPPCRRHVLRLGFAGAAAAGQLLLGGCAAELEPAARLPQPSVIIVREFAAPAGTVTLDPSFGFSLHRGSPGVPPRERAGAVGRAAAFQLADTLAERLRGFGYAAMRSNTATPDPSARTLVVSGAFRHINEGYRRRVGAENSSVAADIWIDYLAPGIAPQRLMTAHLDSRRIPRQSDGYGAASARGGADVNAAARRLGGAVAGAIHEWARSNNWPRRSG